MTVCSYSTGIDYPVTVCSYSTGIDYPVTVCSYSTGIDYPVTVCSYSTGIDKCRPILLAMVVISHTLCMGNVEELILPIVYFSQVIYVVCYCI